MSKKLVKIKSNVIDILEDAQADVQDLYFQIKDELSNERRNSSNDKYLDDLENFEDAFSTCIEYLPKIIRLFNKLDITSYGLHERRRFNERRANYTL